jgi:hypothetical protein
MRKRGGGGMGQKKKDPRNETKRKFYIKIVNKGTSGKKSSVVEPEPRFRVSLSSNKNKNSYCIESSM